MQQLVLFQMTSEAQSLNIAGKANLEKQSNLSSNITASNRFFIEDDDNFQMPFTNDPDEDWGDIYDEYEDFQVCSRVWC